MSRWIRVQTSIFDHELFAAQPYGKADAFVWLSQVWDGRNGHLIARRFRWPNERVWKFLREIIAHGLIHAEKFEELELFYRKKARRTAIPTQVKRAVARRDGLICRYCGDAAGPFHFDHVHPWSKGGEHRTTNIVVSCRSCNLRKKDRSLREMGWKL